MKTLPLFSLALALTISSLLAMPMDPVDGEKAAAQTTLSTSRSLDPRLISHDETSFGNQDPSIQQPAISPVGFNENQTSLANNLSMNTPNITENGSLGSSEYDSPPALPSDAVADFNEHTITPINQILSPERDQILDTYRAAHASFIEAKESHTTASTKAIKATKNSSISSLLTSRLPRAMRQLDTARENLEQAATKASTAAASLGYSNPELLQNQYHYSEEQITLGETTFPKSGVFAFGPELKRQLEASSTAYILERLQSDDQEYSFKGLKGDLVRATFTVRELEQREEFLYDPALKTNPREAARSRGDVIDGNNSLTHEQLLDAGMVKLMRFIGENQALQIAITSLMYQRGTADLEMMNNAGSRGTTAEGEALTTFFTDGLFSVSAASFPDIALPRKNKPENRISWYALDKEPLDDSVVAPRQKFKLTITYSCEDERVDQNSPQEFVRHQGASVVYTFEENPLFNSEQALSLENLPVIVHCIDGHLAHTIAPYEAPIDVVASDIFHRLEPDQQAAVTAYRDAQEESKTAEAIYQQRLSKIAGRSSVLHAPFVAALEKEEVERTLQLAQKKLTSAIQAMRSSTTTARFLEENTSHYSPDKISFQHDDQRVEFPANGCFVGGKKLQQEVTEETTQELATCFNNAQKNPYTSLQADLENVNYSFVLQARAEEPLALSVETGIEQLQEFVGDPETATAIGTIMNKDALVVEMQIINNMPRYHDTIGEQADRPPYSSQGLQGPNDADLIHEGKVSTDYITFTLEKRIPAEDEDRDSADTETPYFVLTITHHLEQQLTADAEEEHGSIHYNRTARFVYMFKKNDDFNYGELLAPENLPVDVRCAGIRIDHTLEHGF